MKNQNKGISTPVGILIILIAILLVGKIVVWQVPRLQEEGFKPETENLTIEMLKNAAYQLGSDRVELVEGRGNIFSFSEGVSSPDRKASCLEPGDCTVQLLTDKVDFGDLNNDGEEDAAVILTSWYGGTGVFYDLAVAINQNGKPYNLVSKKLGDRVVVNSVAIKSGEIVLDMIIHGPDDGLCCPTLPKIFNYRISKDQLVEVQKDETAGWKTYRNEKFGFELKYPPDLISSSTGPNLEQQKLDRGEVISGTVAPSYDTVVFSAKDNVKQFTIEIFHPQERPAFYPNSYGPCDLRWGITSSIDEKTITVNNVGVFKRTIKAQKDEEEAPIFRSCYYFRNHDENLIVLGSVGFINLSDLEKEDLILEKIISTINLSQLDETAGWERCQNIKYGYEIKYPPNWKVWKPGAPEARLATCGENLSIIAFSPNIYDLNEPSLLIDAYNQELLKGTIYEGSKSLEEYFNKSPNLLKNNPIIKEDIIDNEKSVWLQSFSSPRIFTFHNDSIFEINGHNLTSSFFNQMLSTFRFLE